MSDCRLTCTMTFKLTVFMTSSLKRVMKSSYFITTSEPLMILTLFILKDSCRLPVSSTLGSSQFFYNTVVGGACLGTSVLLLGLV